MMAACKIILSLFYLIPKREKKFLSTFPPPVSVWNAFTFHFLSFCLKPNDTQTHSWRLANIYTYNIPYYYPKDEGVSLALFFFLLDKRIVADLAVGQ